MAATSDQDWGDNWQQQVEEAVALHSILGTDFQIYPVNGLPESLEALYQGADEIQLQGLPADCLQFQAIVHLELPSGSLRLQVDTPSQANKSSTEGAGIAIEHLQPLRMELSFPHSYPTCSPPECDISACWLSVSQAQQLKAELQRIWEEDEGSPICYTWISWLQASALECLGVADLLCIAEDERRGGEMLQADIPVHGLLPSSNSSQSQGELRQQEEDGGQKRVEEAEDTEGVSLSREQILAALLRYDATRRAQLFQEGTWTCKICFEEVPGSSCVHPASCLHFFCCSCIAQHCKGHIAEGQLAQLRCPEPGCQEPVMRERVAGLLTREEVERWEDVELEQTLARMPDLSFCPRCQAPCLEDEDHAVLCSRCHFAFCSLCEDAWHPGRTCMSPESKLLVLRERMKGMRDISADIKRKEQEYLSLTRIKETTMQCPSCQMAIVKSEGCNKMTCSHCGTFFCYKCGQKVAGYKHFQGGECELFELADIRAWEALHGNLAAFDQQVRQQRNQDALATDGQMRPGRLCPLCGQMNVKTANNNMIRCWSCQGSYCYKCHKRLRKGEARVHFSPTGCRQHTAD